MFGGGFSVLEGFGASAESANQASQGASKRGGARPDEKQACLPVTLRSIEEAVSERTGDEIRFFGTEPSALVTVAVVEEFVRQTACLELRLNDGTARMQARYYITGDQAPAGLERMQAGCYVSAVGSVRTAPAPHLALLSLRVVESPDEVSYHMIESAFACLKLQGGSKAGAEKLTEKVAMTPPSKSNQENSGLLVNQLERKPTDETPEKEAAPMVAPMPPLIESAPMLPAKPLSGTSLRDAVLQTLTRLAGPDGAAEGMRYDAVANAIGGSASKDLVLAAARELVEEGLAFETIDDEHFQAL